MVNDATGVGFFGAAAAGGGKTISCAWSIQGSNGHDSHGDWIKTSQSSFSVRDIGSHPCIDCNPRYWTTSNVHCLSLLAVLAETSGYRPCSGLAKSSRRQAMGYHWFRHMGSQYDPYLRFGVIDHVCGFQHVEWAQYVHGNFCGIRCPHLPRTYMLAAVEGLIVLFNTTEINGPFTCADNSLFWQATSFRTYTRLSLL